MTTLTREPSFNRASHIGSDSSTRRPIVDTIRSITRRRLASSSNARLVSSIRPRRSTKICSGRLTMISVMSGSRSGASSGPSPMTSSKRISTRRSRSAAVTSAAGGLARKWSSVSCSRSRRIPARLVMSIAAACRRKRSAWISAFAAARAGLRTAGPSVRSASTTAWADVPSRGTARRSTGAMLGAPSTGVSGTVTGVCGPVTGACGPVAGVCW